MSKCLCTYKDCPEQPVYCNGLCYICNITHNFTLTTKKGTKDENTV